MTGDRYQVTGDRYQVSAIKVTVPSLKVPAQGPKAIKSRKSEVNPYSPLDDFAAQA